MLVRNESLKLVDASDIALEVLKELDENPNQNITEQEAQDALAELYYETSLLANRNVFNNNLYAMPEAAKALKAYEVKINLWEKVKTEFCNIAKPDSVRKELVTIIISAIALLTPLGIIVKALLVIIVGYYLVKGINEVCA